MSMATFRPDPRSLHRSVRFDMIGWVCEAVIKNHHDVGAERRLYIDRFFWTQEMAAAIEMRLEPDTVVINVAERTQAEHLIPAAVRQDGPVPSHEAVQSTEARHRLMAGAQE